MENAKEQEEIPKNEINEEKLDADEKEEKKVEEKKDEIQQEKLEDKKEAEEKVEDKKDEEKEEEEKKEDKKDKKNKKKEKEKKEKKEKKKSEKLNIIYSIDEQNKLCVDCGSENPTKVSINNGVIICEHCAKEHESLGSSVSFIKNINDDFDEFLINFIVMGSNTKFKRFLTKEKVDESLSIKDKYRTFNKKYVVKNQVLRKGNLINQNKFSFANIFNKVFNRTKKNRKKSFDKKKKNDITEIDMNKTMPPQEDKKEDINLESTRPFQEDKKETKKKKDDAKNQNEEQKKEDEDIIKEAKNEIKDKEV